jgi:SAM-dependent methyltransferase
MESNLYNKVLQSNMEIFNRFGHEYENRTKFAHEKYLQTFLDLFRSQLKGNRVLDFGCGPGRDLSYFTNLGYEAVGIDGSSAMIDICMTKNLNVVNDDFVSVHLEKNSYDGVWAYTSLTLVPEDVFHQILGKLSYALVPNHGILALGMIKGNGEEWKQDHKYEGAPRYVARYDLPTLESILLQYFGSVWIQEVVDPENSNRKYLHAICKNTNPLVAEEASEAAKNLFNSFAHVYEDRTKTGIQLLGEDRKTFLSYIPTGGTILDLGCGPGRDSYIFKELGYNPVCFDISEENIRLCKQKGLEGIVDDMANLHNHFTHQSIDAVWANCSLTNWVPKKKLEDIINKIKKVLKPGAPIFIGSVLGGFQGWEVDEKYNKLPRYNTHWHLRELLNYINNLGELVYSKEISEDESKRKTYYNTIHLNNQNM